VALRRAPTSSSGPAEISERAAPALLGDVLERVLLKPAPTTGAGRDRGEQIALRERRQKNGSIIELPAVIDAIGDASLPSRRARAIRGEDLAVCRGSLISRPRTERRFDVRYNGSSRREDSGA